MYPPCLHYGGCRRAHSPGYRLVPGPGTETGPRIQPGTWLHLGQSELKLSVYDPLRGLKMIYGGRTRAHTCVRSVAHNTSCPKATHVRNLAPILCHGHAYIVYFNVRSNVWGFGGLIHPPRNVRTRMRGRGTKRPRESGDNRPRIRPSAVHVSLS
jgi:hypothetical protein